MNSTGWDRHKAYAIVMILGFIGVVSSPVAWNFENGKVQDSYPLSWYPMFRSIRGDIQKFTYVVGRGDKGYRHRIPYKYWARGGFNQGRSQLKKIVRKGPDAALRLCEQVAEKLARHKRRWPSKIEQVRVVRGEYDVNRYYVDKIRLPLKERTIAKCPVVRKKEADAP